MKNTKQNAKKQKPVRRGKKRTRIFDIILVGMAIVYFAAIMKLVVLKNGLSGEYRAVTLVPFALIKRALRNGTGMNQVLKNVLGNVAVFVPMGVLLSTASKKFGFIKAIVGGCLISMLIEFTQYMTGWGVTDIDDVIFNTAGAALGSLLYYMIARGLDRRLRVRVGSVLLMAVLGISGIFGVWYFGFGSYLAVPVVNVVAAETVAGLDVDAPEQSAHISTCTADGMHGRPLEYDADGHRIETQERTYALAADVKIYTKTFTYSYAPNGNIRNTTVTYGVSSEAELNALAAESGDQRVDIWFNGNGECAAVVATVYVD